MLPICECSRWLTDAGCSCSTFSKSTICRAIVSFRTAVADRNHNCVKKVSFDTLFKDLNHCCVRLFGFLQSFPWYSCSSSFSRSRSSSITFNLSNLPLSVSRLYVPTYIWYFSWSGNVRFFSISSVASGVGVSTLSEWILVYRYVCKRFVVDDLWSAYRWRYCFWAVGQALVVLQWTGHICVAMRQFWSGPSICPLLGGGWMGDRCFDVSATLLWAFATRTCLVSFRYASSVK